MKRITHQHITKEKRYIHLKGAKLRILVEFSNKHGSQKTVKEKKKKQSTWGSIPSTIILQKKQSKIKIFKEILKEFIFKRPERNVDLFDASYNDL